MRELTTNEAEVVNGGVAIPPATIPPKTFPPATICPVQPSESFDI